ncbi:MAG TPA: Gfo/Idh/MocA family oxidoreductase [Vicinamibacteria bacterium]|nr:Gfo/Idh/MocA family oxidoreductase [Vicinamibacteria bacterium]
MRSDERDAAASSRREFLKTSTAAAVAAGFAKVPGAWAAGSDTLRVGLIGCGGRGTGAAENLLGNVPGVKLVAMGDAFADRLEQCKAQLAKKPEVAALVEVPPERAFAGLDAFEKVLASEVDYVILATPPGFRPEHLRAAVAAGKHIFTEKPVAVDGPGIRTVLAAYEEARARKLGIAAGTQRRHGNGYLATMERIHDGAIGELVSARCYWNQGGLWNKPREPQWTDLEWQMRNWLYFTWLSGDHIVEQHVHNLDVVNWAARAHPVSATGMGGRQVRTGPEYGHIFDHFTIDFEYPGAVHVLSMCRQMPGCDGRVEEALVGTLGTCSTSQDAKRYVITGKNAWRFSAPTDDPYVQEHVNLVASIRAGAPINELRAVAESTLTAIMGRMSAYTGKAVTWDQALGSQQSLVPASASLAWGPMPVPPVAEPGKTELV